MCGEMINPLPVGALRVAFALEPVQVIVLQEIVVKRTDGTAAFWALRMTGVKARCVGSYRSSFTQFVFECEADRLRGLAALAKKEIDVCE
jgi:hypothetical protein